ncbi:hypothetical protein POTOM_033080 [Populus tomentosa]|uniref:Uncharacterized protein n=1 Tax=Populus tomentosa TaxID=118781 RepID=A0A8X7Z563_POPTO|nr:hypothetical protein POTOM_033080 [Populus tomentosa]
MVWGSRMGLPLPSFGFGVFSQLSQCLGPAGSREAVAALSLAFHLGAGQDFHAFNCISPWLFFPRIFGFVGAVWPLCLELSVAFRVLTYAFVCGLLAALGVMD